MSRRPSLVVAAALAAVGLVLAAILAREHASAHAGGTSFCAISEYVNCDRVATSRYAVVLGLPVAVWGTLGYGLALLLALAGLSPRRAHGSWPAGLLVLLAGAASALDVVLAGISQLAVGALCLLCAASWLVSFGLLASAWRACRPAGVAAAIREDLGLLRRRPGRTAGLAISGAVLVFLVAAAYPRYWDAPRRRATPAGTGLAGVPPSGAASPGVASAGPLVVVVFSDYECPSCARAHEDTKALLAGRAGVHLSPRQFPLDSDCNPAVKRRMHPGACDLARVGICAEAQGKLEPMEDLLFANQAARRPVEELARAVGLDLPRLKACLASPDTDARLRADIEAGMRIGLRATPTFVVGGRAYPGELPAEILPPRTAASAVRP